VRRGLVPPCARVPRNREELFGLLPAAGGRSEG